MLKKGIFDRLEGGRLSQQRIDSLGLLRPPSADDVEAGSPFRG